MAPSNPSTPSSSSPVIPFLVAMMLLTGVCNTLLTKYQDMQCVDDCTSPNPKLFEQPVLQTLQMFVGEAGCWLVVFVGWVIGRSRRVTATTPIQDIVYEPVNTEEEEEEAAAAAAGYADEEEGRERMVASQTLIDPTNAAVAKPVLEPSVRAMKPLTGWKVLLLALPAICDICGTTLMNVGLLFVAASIYQMTRGALVLFVGLFSVIFLKRHLGGWKWASLFIVVAGVALVGLAGAIEQKKVEHGASHRDQKMDLVKSMAHMVRRTVEAMKEHTAGETVVGVLMIAGAQIFTASQFVLEESIMEKYSMEPIQVVGWEGIFGFLVTLIGMGVLHAVFGITEEGKGGYFDARAGFYQMFHNRAIGLTSIAIMISIGGFNFFGLSVTRVISATSRSTIDTCRTLFIWIVSLGLGWETFKWLQVVGFVLLVYGTGVFNEVIRPPTINFLRRRLGRRPVPASED